MGYLEAGLAVALYALSHDPSRLLRARRRYVMWADLAIDAPGVERRVYETTVSGRRYKRVVIVVRSRRILRIAKRLLNDRARLRRLVRRYIWVARRVLWRSRAKNTGWLHDLPRRLGRRLFGLEPFDRRVYDMFRRRRYVAPFRGDARRWGYVLHEMARRCNRGEIWCRLSRRTEKRTDIRVLWG